MKRILAVKLADLGDALLIVPALRHLKRSYPAARLEVLTTAAGRSGLEGLPFIDELITFDKYRFDSLRATINRDSLAAGARLLAELRRRQYDAAIFFHHFSLSYGTLKFQALARATGAPLLAGLDNGSPLAGFLNVRVPDEGFGANGLSERAYWRRLVEALLAGRPGRPVVYDERPALAVTGADRKQAGRLLAQTGISSAARLAALGPGSGWYALSRRWPAASYARLSGRLAECGMEVVILGGREEQGLAGEIIRQTGRPAFIYDLTGRTGVKEAVAVLERCELFVGNDSGLAQLAGVAGCPAAIIFGPTNAVAWAPFGTEEGRVKIIQAQMELPCRPCLYRGRQLGSRWGCAARPCLTTIGPEQVFETIQGLAGSHKMRPATETKA